MPNNKISILSTGPLDEALVGKAASENIAVDVVPFTDIKFDTKAGTQKQIEQALQTTSTVVFTSVHAVNFVAAKLLGQKPSWKIFCIGYATRDLVEKYFGKELIAGTADNAVSLAAQIIGYRIPEVIFFCGLQRRNELPELLAEKKIGVKEIILYQTILTGHLISSRYDGIIFLSPGAVQSFFQSNQSAELPVLFAIGHTTAAEIKKNPAGMKAKIVISDKPAKPELIGVLINYFQNHSIHH